VSGAEIAVWVLLGISVGVQVLSVVGVVAARGTLVRLHFASPGAVLAPTPLAAAVLVANGLDQAGVKAILIAVVLAATGPVLGHATARAVRVRELGEWRALLHERADPEQP
jgi:multicomponent Na+:H+ antiporter subunit G